MGKGITYDELYELSFQEVIELLSNTDEEDDNKDNEFSFKENSAVFIGTYFDVQPFSYLADYDETHFRVVVGDA